jgi:hypothetical protein
VCDGEFIHACCAASRWRLIVSLFRSHFVVKRLKALLSAADARRDAGLLVRLIAFETVLLQSWDISDGTVRILFAMLTSLLAE